MIKIAELLDYFYSLSKNRPDGIIIEKRTLREFYNFNKGKDGLSAYQLLKICSKLINEQLLIYRGTNDIKNTMFDHFYECFEYNDDDAKYGTYEFLVYGFPCLREHFKNSVVPIIIKYDQDSKEKEYDIGTCFTIADDLLVTAKHCLPKRSDIKISNHKNEIIEIKEILVSENDDEDVVIIKTNNQPFKGNNHFKFADGEILEEVITMGYPPIPGFDAIQIIDNVVIAGKVRSTTGKLIGMEESYLSRGGQIYYLINARVKGGNSGGPLINKRGEVIGIVTQLPMESNEVDMLGYGLAIPINPFLKSFCWNNGENVKFRTIKPNIVKSGFRIPEQL